MTGRLIVVAVVTSASLAFACRPAPSVPAQTSLNSTAEIEPRGTDVVAPERLVIDAVDLKLGNGPCGADQLHVKFSATDAETATTSLRTVASFGATADEASAAEPELLFDSAASSEIFVLLGSSGRRSGEHFSREQLCFTLAAVDDGANVGPKSEARCLDTTSGCSAAPSLLLPLALLLAARRRSTRPR